MYVVFTSLALSALLKPKNKSIIFVIVKAQTKGSWPNSYKRKMEAPFELDDEFTTEYVKIRQSHF